MSVITESSASLLLKICSATACLQLAKARVNFAMNFLRTWSVRFKRHTTTQDWMTRCLPRHAAGARFMLRDRERLRVPAFALMLAH
jgi:hypothetical protein